MERKEAIEVIKSNWPDSSFTRLRDALETLIPELKESEDERIINAIKEAVESYWADDTKAMTDINIWLEKQGEHKPADKVEPKFEVGDYVINTITNEVEQIIELTDCEYICSGHLIISFNNQHLLRRWTIEDAKDGDVLCCNKIIILFKQWEDNSDCNFVIAHAGIDISGKLQITDGHWLISNETKPATKEQRELLFKAMRKAGYEWDAEKKELRKIEQKPILSEEDENRFRNLIYLVEHSKEGEGTKRGFIGFINNLKSLKERYSWKPNGFDIKLLEGIATGRYNPHDFKVSLWDLINDLKKLKEE